MRIASLLAILLLFPALAWGDVKTDLLDAADAHQAGEYQTAWGLYSAIVAGSQQGAATTTARYNMAMMLEAGQGVQADMSRALEYYQSAADAGLDAAQVRIGLWHQQAGRFTEALEWYLRACKSGNHSAYNNAGNLLMGAVPQLRDRPWGWALMSLAADARNRVARKNLKIYEAQMTAEELKRGAMIKALMMKCVAEGVVR